MNKEFDINKLEKEVNEQIECYNSSQGGLTGYDCPCCKNNGYIAVKRYSFGTPCVVYAECGCMKVRRAIKAKDSSSIASLLKRYNLKNFEAKETWQEHLKEKATNFCEHKNGFFYIGGQVGAGKTRLCVSILNELIDGGNYDFIAILWHDLVRSLKSNIYDAYEYEKILSKMTNVPMLFIDDFLKIKPTDKDFEIAFSIINGRYNRSCTDNNLVTIISSELTGKELMSYDQALASRIYEFCSSGKYFLSVEHDSAKNQRFKEQQNGREM